MEVTRMIRSAALGLLAVGMLASGAARADAIDGNWCRPPAKQFSIRGPAIVTPGGTAMQGDYDRHGFRYVVPPNEPSAGDTVVMQLMNETTVHLRRGADAAGAAKAPHEVWNRCSNSTS